MEIGLEKTPLGRAEWIKFFGVLFDKEKEADSIFNELENNYLTMRKNLASKSQINLPLFLVDCLKIFGIYLQVRVLKHHF